MPTKSNFSLERRETFYKREISKILYKIIQENNLPSFSPSYCILSGGESLKIYLTFSQEENQEKLLETINKKFSPLIKKEIAKCKKFSYVPNLKFLLDKKLEEINSLREIVNKIK